MPTLNKAFAVAYHKSLSETDTRMRELKARLAARGAILSGATVQEIATLQGEHINTIVQAKADALLDAYELYGAEIDDSILAAAADHWTLLAPFIPALTELLQKALAG